MGAYGVHDCFRGLWTIKNRSARSRQEVGYIGSGEGRTAEAASLTPSTADLDRIAHTVEDRKAAVRAMGRAVKRYMILGERVAWSVVGEWDGMVLELSAGRTGAR